VTTHHRPNLAPTIQALSLLTGIVIGIIAFTIGATLGTEWRAILQASPLNAAPAAGLLTIAVIGGLGIVGGLTVMTGTRWAIGPGLFATGVGLSCGVVIGFLVGAG
jgi:hypothetical protein